MRRRLFALKRIACLGCSKQHNVMSNTPPPPPSPVPLVRSISTGIDYTHDTRLYDLESPHTPTPTHCCSQFTNAFPEPPPSPPRLRRTDTASNYASNACTRTVSGYDRWLLDDNYSRLIVLEQQLTKQLSEIGSIRESIYQLSRRMPPPAPSSPVTRQVASPNAAPASAPAPPPVLDMTRDFGM